nr:hypothetical protein [Tanacetum cinerariifolium]
MSTPAYVDLETITQADEVQSSRVPILLPDEPYVAVRRAQLVDTDTESEPGEAPSKAEESQPLGSRVTLMSEEFKASKPSGTRTISSYSLASSIVYYMYDRTCSTARMTVRAQPAMSPGHSTRVAEAMTLSDSAFRKRYRSSYETPSPSLTLPVRKRYKGTSELILDIDSEGDELGDKDNEEDGEDESSDADDERERSEDEGPGLKGREDEAIPEGQQQAVPATDTFVGEPLGLGYGTLRRRELVVGEDHVPVHSRVYTDISAYVPPVAPVQPPPSPEWSFVSLPVSPSSPVVPSPIASPVATLTATISVDDDQFLNVGAQLELYESILHDHTQRLDALPPTLFEGYDMDLRDLYTRPILALEVGQSDAQRAALWHAIYDIPRENHDLRRRIAEERSERLELTDLVARMEKRQESGGE